MYYFTYSIGRVAAMGFANPETYAEICYMPVDLVRDYSYLLIALNCSRDIDPDEFQLRANDWMQRFYSNDDLSWNWFSVTVGFPAEINIFPLFFKIFTSVRPRLVRQCISKKVRNK